MNTLLRWGRFNLVGGVGVGLQLGSLTLLQRWHWHYLLASAIAVELTIVHNFLWHLRFTWRDRRGSRLGQFVRFQFSNGAVSLFGNLLFMRILVQGVRVPVLFANGIAIVACSVANFCLAHRWVFQSKDGHAVV